MCGEHTSVLWGVERLPEEFIFYNLSDTPAEGHIPAHHTAPVMASIKPFETPH